MTDVSSIQIIRSAVKHISIGLGNILLSHSGPPNVARPGKTLPPQRACGLMHFRYRDSIAILDT